MEECWRKCSMCKKDIPYRGIYYVCSVSTCRAKRTDYAFCSVPCWDGHIPIERHRGDSAGALEKQAPRKGEERTEKKRVIVSSPSASPSTSSSASGEILVVASKVKKYINDTTGFNTSASVMKALSLRVQSICDRSIEEARRQGRKTVLDRDVP